jgi:NADH-quinone oxidoreductase subunit N
MGLDMRDILLISPELALTCLGILVVLLDLVVGQRKGLLLAVATVGLLVPASFGLWLWGEMGVLPTGAEDAFYGAMVVDKFAIFFKFLILGVLALVLMASGGYAARFRQYQGEFIGLLFFSATGLMLLAAAADLITIFISLELASLPIVALAAFLRTEVRSIEAGVKFLVLAAISSAVLLYGFAFIYGATGTARLFSLDPAVHTISSMVGTGAIALPFGSYALLIGAVLSVAGFGFKLSMVPFHMWTPDVYEGSPTPVAAFLAVASKAAAFAVILRLFHTGLGPLSADWTLLFAGLAAVTMTVGNLVAIPQRNIKRLLGYSTIAHAGYMLIGVAAVASQDTGGESLGSSGLLFYLVAYGATTMAAFFAVIAISNKTGSDQIEDLAGMAQRSPWLAGVLALALISLTGIPPTAGFMGKLFLFNAAVDANLIWLALLGVVNSVISAYYYLRIVRVMYLQPARSLERISTDLSAVAALTVATAAVLALGIIPGPLLDVARTTVGALTP